MRLLGQIILLCLIVTALQGAMAVLMIAIVLSLIWGLFYRPEETLGCIGLGLLLAALQVHPWLTIGAALALAAVVLIARVRGGGGAADPPIALPPPDDAPE